MRLLFTKRKLKLTKRGAIAVAVGLAFAIGTYIMLTRPQKAEPEEPTVIVEPADKDNVEIHGEYVGRIRA